MAGDWIKVEHATLDKPEVLRTAEMLGISPDACIGLFVRYFIWLDKNLSGSCPDVVRNVSAKNLDDLLHCPGFGACLTSIGWGQFDETAWSLRVINAETHNGTSAKTRALDARRKSDKRRGIVRETSGVKPDMTRTREEKSSNNPIVPFDRFWMAYPLKVKKAVAEKAWAKINPDEILADRILSAVAAAKQSKQWRDQDGKFIPHASTWLNGQQWNDEAPSIPGPADEHAKKVAWALG